MMKNINNQINEILKNIDDDEDSKKPIKSIKHLKDSADFKNIIEEIDSYTNEIHEEFDEIKYLIKFADNTHKLIDRHKNVMTNIFRGAGLRPTKKLEEDEKLKTMKKKIKKLQKSSFMTGFGLTKTKKPLEIKSKTKEKDEMMNNINAQINAILKNIDDEDDSKKVSRDIKHLKKSTDFKNIIEEIDSYTNEIHEEFDEIKYLIKFADNTHKLIDRHKNVMTNIFRGAGLRPSKRIEEEEKLKNEKGKIKKFKSAGKFVVDNIGSYNEDENEYDDQPYYKNGYYYRNAKEDDMNFGEVFDKLKAINKVKDNLSNIQDDFLGYHQNLRTKMRRINGGK
jgi:UDP-N-acetylglucosamine transferase subunit ALG13